MRGPPGCPRARAGPPSLVGRSSMASGSWTQQNKLAVALVAGAGLAVGAYLCRHDVNRWRRQSQILEEASRPALVLGAPCTGCNVQSRHVPAAPQPDTRAWGRVQYRKALRLTPAQVMAIRDDFVAQARAPRAALAFCNICASARCVTLCSQRARAASGCCTEQVGGRACTTRTGCAGSRHWRA